MDADWKLAVGFMADILYIKGFLCYEEFEAIQSVKSPNDVQQIVEKMLRGDYNVYRKGESYIRDLIEEAERERRGT